MPFIPHTLEEKQSMLKQMGAPNTDALFDEIPTSLFCQPLTLPGAPLTEMQATRLMQTRAEKDGPLLNFIGAGAYEHHIPAAVWEITSRGEFLTAYTPYQPEASQGTLQLLYEYQTMMASLTGMAVSNASLYDGASSLAEAILMAVRLHKGNTVLLPQTLSPFYRETVRTIVSQQNITLVEVPYTANGITDIHFLKNIDTASLAALVIPHPNFFGCLEEVDTLVNWAHAQGLLSIAVVNPTSLALLKEPGQWGETGADLVCGEGQPLGIPLASGGPYFGFLCSKKEYVRQMPGRIIGKTQDSEGKQGFVLTLQAREQHIRRAKATSNICTNQSLLVTAATIYMSLLGPTGLQRVASHCHHNTQQLLNTLLTVPGVTRRFSTPFFHETVLHFPCDSQALLAHLAKQNIQAGFDLSPHYPDLKNGILMCATETKTPEEIHTLATAISDFLNT